MLTIFFYIFIASIAIEFIQYFLIYNKVAFQREVTKKTAVEQLPVSVIVYVKNNEALLKDFLITLIQQEYSSFEIIVINNASEDNSLEILKAFTKAYPNAKLVDVENNEAFWGNKKYALTLGIKVAKYERLLFVEPVATPMSNQWIASMAEKFSTKKEVVLGFTSISRKKKSLANMLLRYQNVIKFSHAFVWSTISKPVQGNAYNQSYTKSTFFKVNGFIEHMKIPFSDEYSFIKQIGTATNMTWTLKPESFTNKQVNNQVEEWLIEMDKTNLLLRSSTAMGQFKIRFFNFFKIIFFTSAVVLGISLFKWEVVGALFLLRYLLLYVYSANLFKRFDTKELLFTLPILEIIHLVTSVYYQIVHIITRKRIEKKYF